MLTLVLDSCGLGAPTVQQGSTELPYHAISVDTAGGYFGGLAWPSGGWLFVGYQSGSVSAHPQVRRLRPDGSGFQAVSLPDNPACTRTYYGGFGILHDGRLAIVQTCQLPTGSSPSASYAVIAYDIRSGGVAPIFPLQTMIHPGGASFNATDDRAVTAQGGNI